MSWRPCNSWLKGKGCRYANHCHFHHDESLNEFNTCNRHGWKKPCKLDCYRLPFFHQFDFPGPRHTSQHHSASSAAQPAQQERTRSRSRSPRLSKDAAVQTEVEKNIPKYTVEEIFAGYFDEWRLLSTQQLKKDYKNKLLKTFHPDKWRRGSNAQKDKEFADAMTKCIIRAMMSC